MLIGTVEHNAKTALLSLVEDINNQHAVAWGIVGIKRPYLKNLTNEDMVLAVKPALQEVSKARIFFMGDDAIYVTWFGIPKLTCQKLTSICQSLMRPGIMETVDNIITYFDPHTMGEELRVLLNRHSRKEAIICASPNEGQISEFSSEECSGCLEFMPTLVQVEQFHKLMELRPSRKRLSILIVEDQSFLRNLLSGVLRIDFEISVASNLKEGWAIFLEKAPDIIFMDIQLPDGSGHMLAHAMKELDPSSYIAMVTASNRRDDVELAKQNHVDGFVVKPFNKKIITDCIDHYLASHNVP